MCGCNNELNVSKEISWTLTLPYYCTSVFEEATIGDETLRELTFLLFPDIIIPEAILVIIVVDRYLVLISDVRCSLDFVYTCIFLKRPVGQAILSVLIKLVVLNWQLLLEYLCSFFITVHLVHFLHDFLQHVILRCFVVIQTITQKHPLELFRVSTIICRVVFSVWS